MGIAPLDLNIEQKFTHNFIVCTKLKQHFILGSDLAQRYKISIDWDINAKLFLGCKGKKIATSLKASGSGKGTVASLKISTDEQNETDKKIPLIATATVTIPPHHLSLVSLKAINQVINTKFTSKALLEIEENPFLTIEQPELVLMSTLHRLGSQVLWNPDGQNLILKQNMTISYVKKSDCKEKDPKNNLKMQGNN